MIELIAKRAIEKAPSLLNVRLQQARTNLEILADWVHEHQKVVEWVRPQGGVCAFLRFRGISDIEAFCHHLARTYGVLLVPGTCFNYPSHVRLGFGGPTADLREGLSRLSNLLKEEDRE